MKISDVLWKAANEQLWDGDEVESCYRSGHKYSCDAVWAVCSSYSNNEKIADAMYRMGMDPDSCIEFDSMRESCSTEQIQGARYAWLMFVHDLAVERGL